MSEEMQENKTPGEGEGREPGKSRRRRRRARSQDKPRTEQAAVNGASPADAASSRPAPDSGAQAGDAGGEKKGRSRRRKRKTRSQQSTQQPQPQQKASARKSRGGGGGDGGQRERRRGGGGGGGGTPDNIGNRVNGKQSSRRLKTPESKFGGREPRVDPFAEPEHRNGPLELTPFELFCAYHLGIADDNRYRQPNLREVARRFACSTGEIESALKRFGMDRDSLRKASYDISLAQLDIQVAPDGIDKRELAKVLFSEFLDTAPHAQMLIEAANRDDATERVAED